MKDILQVFDSAGLLKRVKRRVDPRFEIPAIIKEAGSTPLLFENIKGSRIPVASNICGSRDLVALGLGIKKDEIIKILSNAIDNPKEPFVSKKHDYREMEVDLGKVPILTYYPTDGGPYVSSGVVIAKDNELGTNASFHRGMVIGKDRMVFRILDRDFGKFISRGLKEFAYCIGSPIQVLMAAAISTETPELGIANALKSTELVELAGHAVPKADIVMIMEFTGEMADEGPYVDLTETSDVVRKQRVARVKKIFAVENPIFHGLLAGDCEHKTLMGMPREPSIYREVAKVCDVRDVYVTPGGSSWLHGAVSIRKRGENDGKNAIAAAFSGHKSMKHVFIVDDDVDIHKPEEIEWAMATRFQGDTGIVVFKDKGSSLDPSSDFGARQTAKVGFDLTIPWGADKKFFDRPKMKMKIRLSDYIE